MPVNPDQTFGQGKEFRSDEGSLYRLLTKMPDLNASGYMMSGNYAWYDQSPTDPEERAAWRLSKALNGLERGRFDVHVPPPTVHVDPGTVTVVAKTPPALVVAIVFQGIAVLGLVGYLLVR